MVRTAVDFVGRDAELGRVLRRWAAAAEGSGTEAVLVGGEPGIGKTTLADRVASEVAATGAAVFRGRADDPSAPFQPWVAALRPVGFASTLRDLVTSSDTGGDARTLVVEAVVDALETVGPALVVLDDLHWADESSLFLIRHVMRSGLAAPVLLLGLFRDTEPRPPLARLLADLRPVAGVDRMSLVGLPVEAVAVLAGEERAESVHARTGGNPFYVAELVRHGDRPSLGLAEVISSRLEPLGSDARAVLEVLATAGAGCPPEVVEVVLGRPVGAAVAEARAAGLVVGDDQALGFVHELVREAVADSVGAGGGRRIHLLLARAFADLGRDVDAERHQELAGGAPALSAVSGAARRARDAGAYETAAARWERAAEIATTPQERIANALRAADDHARAGDVLGEHRVLLSVLATAGEIGDLRAEVGALSRLPFLDAPPVDVDALVTELLERIPAGDSPERARLLSRLFYERAQRALPGSVVSILDEAASIAGRVGDGAVLGRAAFIRLVYFPSESGAEELDQLERYEAEVREVFGPRVVGRMRAARIAALLSRGDVSAAGEAAAALAGSSAEGAGWVLACWRAAMAFMRGDLDEAVTLSAAARRIGSALGEEIADPSHLQMTGEVATLRGGPAVDGPRLLGALGEFHAMVEARNLVLDGDSTGARALLAGLPAGAVLVRQVPWPVLVYPYAETIARLPDRRLALELLDELAPQRGRFVVPPYVPSMCLGSTDRYLGLLAECVGRTDDALDLLRSALDLDLRIGAEVWVAHDRFELGRLLLADDPPAGLEMLDRAAADADRLGLGPLRGRIDTARATPLLRRTDRDWSVLFDGVHARVPDRRGIELLAVLLADAGREIGALELSGGGSVDRPPVLDDRAKAEYRRRLAELDAELDEAASWNDPVRLERSEAERAALIGELSRAVGLGGRDRSSGSDSERARVRVTRAIARAVDDIERAHPALGAHLRATIRTGTFCSYRPDPRVARPWKVSG